MSNELTASRSAAKRAFSFPARIIFSLVKPAVKIARRFNISLDVLHNLVDMAYIEELRSVEGMTNNEISLVMGKSRRTVGYLLQRYREDFFSRAEDLELFRSVEAEVLRGCSNPEEIAGKLPEQQKSRISAALNALTQTGRIRKREGESHGVSYEVSNKLSSWVTDNVESRIDGLNHQMRGIAAAVWSRFILENKDTSAVRTYGFKAEPEAVAQLIKNLIRYVRNECVEVEEEALAAETGSAYILSFSVAPENEGE